MYKFYEDLLIEDFEEDLLNELFVQELVQKLPPNKMAVLSLKISDAFTTEEMSEILGISTGTIWSRYKSALKQLRKEVKPK